MTFMLVVSELNLTLRALACVILSMKGSLYLLGILGGEMMVYFAVKIIRCDLTYRRRTTSWWETALATFFGRFIAKAMVDWTACPQVRV